MGTPVTYTYIPSLSRTVRIEGFWPLPCGSFPPPPPPPLIWPPKDPTDTLDYVVDFADAITSDQGDAIATLDITISPDQPGDLTLVKSTGDGTLAILWLTAGFAGTTYNVNVAIGTNSGRTLGRTVQLPVVTLAIPPTQPNDLETQTDAVITDQNGQPITTS